MKTTKNMYINVYIYKCITIIYIYIYISNSIVPRHLIGVIGLSILGCVALLFLFVQFSFECFEDIDFKFIGEIFFLDESNSTEIELISWNI
jgi:hypothetical protein